MSLFDSSKRKRKDEASVQCISTDKKKQQYVAVRQGKLVSKCIFNSWKDAEEHLEGTSIADYRICDDIEEAVAFAFDDNSESSRQANNDELQLSVSHIDEFADDIIMMICSFVCGTYTNTLHFDKLLPSFGAASKSCRKRCIQYTRQVPLRVEADPIGSGDRGRKLTVKKIAWLSKVGVKIGDIRVMPKHPLHLALLLHMFNSCNMEHLRRFSFDLYLFKADGCTGELDAAKWKLRAIEDGIPYIQSYSRW